ncbi:PQQ-binding-like beta-propeller repeat protein [Streptomyces sp. E11-3]|uniref:outer membrane protein assembly factor BamB family protein n=1 Tax=Streptomyces sp. E11-3 TaxID=3110112 RepID=UPI00398184F8
MEIARRAGSVWHARPHRLPAPPEHALAEAFPSGTPSVTSRLSRLSRRKLLALGGSSALGAAAVSGGAWAWLGRGRGRGDTTAPKPPAAASKKPAWDLLWQVATSSVDPQVPPVPLVLDGLLVAGEFGVQGLNPVTGAVRWSDPEVYFLRRTATDGKRIYAADHTLEESDPLSVSTVDPATGEINAPFSELKDLRAILDGTQVLCATADAVYLAGGRGPHTESGFGKAQSWFLLGIDIRSGDKLWEVPLPARPDESTRLHFLSAESVGEYLVLVQQSADGEPRLVVHNALTGEALWNRPLDGEQPAFSRAHLAVDGRHVYPSAGELVALGLADGKEAWRFEGETPKARFSPPATKDGVVYAVEENRGIVALDAADGSLRWAEKSREVTTEDLDAPPVIGVASVYAHSKESSALVAVDIRTGAVTRRVKAAKARYFAHASARRLIAVGDEHTAAYPLD